LRADAATEGPICASRHNRVATASRWHDIDNLRDEVSCVMPIDKHLAVEQFRRRFGEEPVWVVRAPGRVNLIGEHTDYNDGFVLPLAIDRAIWIALRPRADRRVYVYSADFEQQSDFSLDELVNQRAGWIEYIKGTAWSLQLAGQRLRGWEGVLLGDVPQGAGLSSSAALEIAAARAFAAASDLPWDPQAMALLAQKAENHWVGVQCGIMDQLISARGIAGHALLIDCRTLEIYPAPFPAGCAVVILDTVTRRGLVYSQYNQRRRQCEDTARLFGVRALRDITLEQLEQAADRLDHCTFRRARHVISENNRTLRAVEAMKRNDLDALGRLMDESHASLRDDFEVSSDALNTMVRCARQHPACYGARMTGAGFGGCAVAVIDAQAAEDFSAATAAAYKAETGLEPAVYVCQASDGASLA